MTIVPVLLGLALQSSPTLWGPILIDRSAAPLSDAETRASTLHAAPSPAEWKKLGWIEVGLAEGIPVLLREDPARKELRQLESDLLHLAAEGAVVTLGSLPPATQEAIRREFSGSMPGGRLDAGTCLSISLAPSVTLSAGGRTARIDSSPVSSPSQVKRMQESPFGLADEKRPSLPSSRKWAPPTTTWRVTYGRMGHHVIPARRMMKAFALLAARDEDEGKSAEEAKRRAFLKSELGKDLLAPGDGIHGNPKMAAWLGRQVEGSWRSLGFQDEGTAQAWLSGARITARDITVYVTTAFPPNPANRNAGLLAFGIWPR